MGFLDIFNKKVPETLVEKASKGTIKNSFYGSMSPKDKQGQPSPVNMNVFLDLYKKDPVVQAALTTRSEAILNSGWTVEGSKTAKKQAEDLLKKINFNYTFLDKVVLNALLYEHVFIEIERTNSGNPSALHVLETSFMEIEHDVHGDIIGYYQQGETGDKVFFPIEDIVYLKFNSITSAVWGENGLESLLRTLTTKNFFEKFLNSMAINNDFRQIFKTTMADDNIKEFLPYLQDARLDPNQPIVMKIAKKAGESMADDNKFETMRNPSDLKEFLGVLEYLRTQSLMRLKVPPIMIGVPDSSNRSNSDSQIKAFNISNEAFRRKLDDGFVELFDKLGIGSVDYAFNPIDKRSEKDDVEVAERLINMGADPKVIEGFLRTSGLALPEGKLFLDKPEMEQDPKVGVVSKKSMDMYPSRKGKSEGESNKKIGSGEDGTTRPDQLAK